MKKVDIKEIAKRIQVDPCIYKALDYLEALIKDSEECSGYAKERQLELIKIANSDITKMQRSLRSIVHLFDRKN